MMNINLGSIFLGKEIPSLPSVEAMGDFTHPMTPARNPGHDFPAWAVRALPTWWAMPQALGGAARGGEGAYGGGRSGGGGALHDRFGCGVRYIQKKDVHPTVTSKSL